MRDWNAPVKVGDELASDVLILPMRDWNPFWPSIMLSNHASFWSYLWGIEIPFRLPSICCSFRRFDLTYEGLKSDIAVKLRTCVRGFDLTYEGLKFPRSERTQFANCLFWSYLWGIEILKVCRTYDSKTAFWSYLWGIEIPTFWTYPICELSVLILPMRDWNLSSQAST